MRQKIGKLMEMPFFKKALAGLLAILGALGAVALLKFIARDSVFVTNSLIVPVVGVVLYLLYDRLQPLKQKSEKILCVVFSLILASILVIGAQLEFLSEIVWSWKTLLKILCTMCLCYPFVQMIINLLDRANPGKFEVRRKHALTAFGCIFFVTIIVWLIIFPGIYTYDMASQNELISRGDINSHWSLLYGYLLAGFLDFGHLIFKNYEGGFALAMLVQLCFICAVETKLVFSVAKWTKNRVMYVLSIAFFCLIPFLPTMAVTAAQDTLFAGLLALFVIELVDITQAPERLGRWWVLLKLGLLGLSLCITRNNGVYGLLVLLIYVVIFFKQPKKRNLVITLGATIVAVFIFNGPVLKLLNVSKPTTIREILSVPSQQLAHTYYQESAAIDTEDRAKIAEYYDIEGTSELYSLELHQKYPMIADYTKDAMFANVVQDNLGDYVGLWVRVGINNIDEYMEAFLLNSLGFWYPQKNAIEPRMNLDFMNYPGFAMTSAFNSPAHSDMKKVEPIQIVPASLTNRFLRTVFEGDWQKVPLLATFCSMGVYGTLLLFVVCYLLAKKRYNALMPISLIFGLYLTLLISPVAIFRYIYPIVMLAPVMVASCFGTKNKAMPKVAAKRMTKSATRKTD